MTDLKKQAIGGVKWTSLSTGVRAILQFVVLLVLARFLSAEDFGLVAIVMVVIGFSQLFMDMGISNAIIHKKVISEIQLSSLYWLNIFSGTIITFIVYVIAPYVAIFYNEKEIIPLLQLLSFSFIINSIGNQYRILLRKELKFDLLAKIEVLSGVASFLCAIILAMNDFGAYSLIFSTLASTISANTILLIIGLKLHKPQFVFNHKEIKDFLTFGLYQMGQNSIVYFNSQFDVILIGKLLGTEALGVYNLTKQLVMRPTQVVNPIIMNVSFPVMAKVQDDINKLKSIYLRILKTLSFIVFPIYIFFFISAPFLIPFLFDEKWNNAIGVFQILSIYALIRAISSPAGSLLLSKGRADIGFYWSLAGFFALPISIYIGSSYNIEGVAFSLLIYQLVFFYFNWFFIVNKMCQAKFYEYLYSMASPLIISALSALIAVLGLKLIDVNISSVSTLVLISIGFISYSSISFYFNKDFKKIILQRGKI